MFNDPKLVCDLVVDRHSHGRAGRASSFIFDRRLYSARQVSFNRTKIGGKCQNFQTISSSEVYNFKRLERIEGLERLKRLKMLKRLKRLEKLEKLETNERIKLFQKNKIIPKE